MTITPMIRRIVLWEPCASPHTHYLFAALARLHPSVSVITCADADLPPERRALGWQVPRSPGMETVIQPSEARTRELASTDPQGSVHILCALRRVPTIMAATGILRGLPAHLLLLHEPRVLEGPGGIVRLLQTWVGEGWHRRHLAGVLAIGRNGPPWFRLAGYRRARIHPFAYFVPEQPAVATDGLPGRLRIGFVGRWIAMKGVPDLIAAMPLLGPDAELHLAGRGVDEPTLRAQAADLGVQADFHGVIPNQDIGRFLSGLDVLVLPSRSMDDGWGVVVSEALMQGVPVVATRQVGASIMLDDPRNGRCVAARDPAGIARAIQDLVRSGATTPAARSERRERSCRQLTAEAGAAHLTAIINHVVAGAPRPHPFYASSGEG
jgi:glycosyltransferase involved in cell wall biosynthesis